MDAQIEVTIVYLGGSRDEAGCARESVALPSGSTIADAARLVAERHPRLAPRLTHVRWARNFEFAGLDTKVSAGDELGVLPPVCGGAPLAHLTREVVDPHEALAAVASAEVGATVLFVGTVRRHSHGRVV